MSDVLSHSAIPFEAFADEFSATTELSSVALGGQVISVSDEFFADAFHLLLVEPASSMKGQFGPKGALYSGWETRRHNPTFDWCIIKLGTSGSIVGFDVDTSNFNGNEAPKVSVEILHTDQKEEPLVHDSRWSEVLPKVNLGPDSRHLFKIPQSTTASHVKLNMYPDGGIARFRVYGHVVPVFPSDVFKPFDMAHVFAGGVVVYTSDQHFGVGSNLILPGRGKHMGDGWETKRSRQKGHKDYAIIKLGSPGALEYVEVDTLHFKGNFPDSCELHAIHASDHLPIEELYKDRGSQEWTQILPRTKLGPHRQHYFQLESVAGQLYTHVKITIHPDGGLKRVRVIGRRAADHFPEAKPLQLTETASISPPPIATLDMPSTSGPVTIVPVLPLTPEAFAPFGHVVQAYGDVDAAPRGTRITAANFGTADKFHKLAPILSSYPPGSNAAPGLSVYRCKPLENVAADRTTELTAFERHPYTNQAFIPMGKGAGEGIVDPADSYLVVVTKNGEDDKPDVATIRAFLATSAQGIVYGDGVWHQPMTVLNKPLDLTCVETQIGDGSAADCEIVALDRAKQVIKLQLPSL
ncbi:allantoicase [Pleurotus eryngii]|uniref:Allantoicase n=1 Tax=Pleurotus eryngii TaxID=5323 RepID=A0A9P6DCN4_PLEER|nr:allantoicase [Pleurotus eryngii]